MNPAPPPAVATPPVTATPSATATPPACARVYWREFDLLRGLAAVMMVVNHVGVNLLDPRYGTPLRATEGGVGLPAGGGGALGWAVWIGAFAPVVFFFVTGLGYGVQHAPGTTKPRSQFGLMRKFIILMLADAMLWLHPGRPIGLDFFGFIAVSMLVLTGLLRLRHAVAAAAGLLVFVVAVRYGVGPVAERMGAAPGGWIDQCTGRVPVANYAFPLFPWLGYPLAGFIMGAGLTRVRPWYATHRAAAGGVQLLAAMVLAGVSAAAVVVGGIELFRWGSLTLSYFVAGFAVLAVIMAAATVVVETTAAPLRTAVDAWSLRGVAAFAAVPLHFLVIGLAKWAGLPAAVSAGAAWGVVAAVVVWTVGVAHGFTPLSRWARRLTNPWPAWLAGGAVVAAALAALWWGHGRLADQREVIAAVGQVVLCGMLVLPAVSLRRRSGVSVREPAGVTSPGRASM